MVKEDITWMGLGITETVTQSDRLPLYYDLCTQLIKRGGAYVCTCNNDLVQGTQTGKDCMPVQGSACGEKPRTMG